MYAPNGDFHSQDTDSLCETPASTGRHNYYARLRLRPYRVTSFEVTEAAAKERARLLAGAQGPLTENLRQALDEVLAAEVCLCDPHQKRVYDLDLQRTEIVKPARRESGVRRHRSRMWSLSRRPSACQDPQRDVPAGSGQDASQVLADRPPASSACVAEIVGVTTIRADCQSSVPEPHRPKTQTSSNPLYRLEPHPEPPPRMSSAGEQILSNQPALPTFPRPATASRSRIYLAALVGALLVPLAWAAYGSRLPIATNVELSTMPEGCTIIIDGRQLAVTTPASLPLAAGSHQLHLAKSGFRAFQTSLNLDGKQGIRRERYTLQALPSAVSHVTIITQPSGARIEIDGKSEEKQTPATVSAAYGQRQISLSLAGYERLSADLDIHDPTHSLSFKLERKLVDVNLTSDPAGASVLFDGRKQSVTPVTVRAPLGQHLVELELEGFQRVQQPVEISERQPDLNFLLAKLPPKAADPLGLTAGSKPASSALVTPVPPVPPALSSSANSGRSGQATQTPPSGPAIYRPQFDVQGEHLSEPEKKEYVEEIKRILGGMDWPKGKVHFVSSLSRRIADSRLTYAHGLLCEKRLQHVQALDWYRKAAEEFDCPYYAPWHRLIHLELRRGEDEKALTDCLKLIERTTKDAAHESSEFDFGKALAENVEFVGGILGYLSVNTSGVLPIRQVEADIKHLVVGGAGRSDLTSLLSSATQDIRKEFMYRSQREDAINAEQRDAAMGKDIREIQGEREFRTTRGEHFSKEPEPITMPNRIAQSQQLYPFEQASHTDYVDVGVPGTVIRTTDRFFRIKEYHLKDEPQYRHTTRFSKLLRSYLPDSIDLDRYRLLESFPDRYRAPRASTVEL